MTATASGGGSVSGSPASGSASSSGGGGMGGMGGNKYQKGIEHTMQGRTYRAQAQEARQWKIFHAKSKFLAKLGMQQIGEKLQFDVKQLRTAKQENLSAQRHLYGYAGVKMEGTPKDVQEATARIYDEDEEMLRKQARLQQFIAYQEYKYAKKAEKFAKRTQDMYDRMATEEFVMAGFNFFGPGGM